MEKYIVCDTEGCPMGVPFRTRLQALEYKAIFGRPDWTIKQVQFKSKKSSTPKQRKAVFFVEMWCHIEFEGNITDFYEVSDFLECYLEEAKEIAEDAQSSYFSMLNGY